jgi:hypothetical protein
LVDGPKEPPYRPGSRQNDQSDDYPADMDKRRPGGRAHGKLANFPTIEAYQTGQKTASFEL